MARKKKNPNVNCLEGWRCPKCKQTDRFVIGVYVMADMRDDGVEEYFGDTEYDLDNYARCGACDCVGTVRTFQDEQ